MFVRCSAVASPPSSQLSTPSAAHNGTSAQLQATRPSSSARSPDTPMSVPLVHVPAVSSLGPRGHLQQPAMLNPVFVDNRLPSVRPVAVSPSAVVSMPLVPRGLSPQQYTDPSIPPRIVKLSPVMQPHISTTVTDSAPCGMDSNIQRSSVVGDS